MTTQQQTPAIPDLLPGFPNEVAEAGRQIAAFMDSPAFPALTTAVRSYQGGLSARLTGMAPSDSGARYADVVGEMRGVARIEPILRGIVESGKAAEAEIRAAEERGT